MVTRSRGGRTWTYNPPPPPSSGASGGGAGGGESPAPATTPEKKYAGYGGYYATPQEASASIQAHAASSPSSSRTPTKQYAGRGGYYATPQEASSSISGKFYNIPIVEGAPSPSMANIQHHQAQARKMGVAIKYTSHPLPGLMGRRANVTEYSMKFGMPENPRPLRSLAASVRGGEQFGYSFRKETPTRMPEWLFKTGGRSEGGAAKRAIQERNQARLKLYPAKYSKQQIGAGTKIGQSSEKYNQFVNSQTKNFERVTGLPRANPFQRLTKEEIAIYNIYRHGRKFSEWSDKQIDRFEGQLTKFLHSYYYSTMRIKKPISFNQANYLANKQAKEVSYTIRQLREGIEDLPKAGMFYTSPYSRANIKNVVSIDFRKKIAYLKAHPSILRAGVSPPELSASAKTIGRGMGRYGKGEYQTFKQHPYGYGARFIGQTIVATLALKGAGKIYKSPIGAPVRIPISKVVRNLPYPRFEGGVQIGKYKYYGPYISTKKGAMPIIGRYKGKWVLGNPGKVLTKADLDDYIKFGKYVPKSKLETTIIANPNVMKQLGYKYPEQEIERHFIVSEAGRRIEHRLPSSYKQWRTKFLREGSDRLTKDEVDDILRLTQSFYKQGKIEQIYGSSTAMPYIKKNLRRPWGDIDIQLRVGEKEAERIAYNYAKRLGSQFKVDSYRKTLVLKRVGGKWVHALDIHSKDVIPDLLAPGAEGAYGFKFGLYKIKTEKLPTMPLSEFTIRKGTASLIWQKDGLHPPAHLIKHVSDFYIGAKSALRVTDREYKLLQRWKALNPQIDWEGVERAGAQITLPLLAPKNSGRMIKVSPALLPFVQPSVKVIVSTPLGRRYYSAGKIVSASRRVSPSSKSKSLQVSKYPSSYASTSRSISRSPSPYRSKSPYTRPSPSKYTSPYKKPSPKRYTSPYSSPSSKPSPSPYKAYPSRGKYLSKSPSPSPRYSRKYIPAPRWVPYARWKKMTKAQRRHQLKKWKNRKQYYASALGVVLGAKAPKGIHLKTLSGIEIRGVRR